MSVSVVVTTATATTRLLMVASTSTRTVVSVRVTMGVAVRMTVGVIVGMRGLAGLSWSSSSSSGCTDAGNQLGQHLDAHRQPAVLAADRSAAALVDGGQVQHAVHSAYGVLTRLVHLLLQLGVRGQYAAEEARAQLPQHHRAAGLTAHARHHVGHVDGGLGCWGGEALRQLGGDFLQDRGPEGLPVLAGSAHTELTT